MNNKPRVVTLSDRLRNAWRAFKGNEIGCVQFGVDVKRCDLCDKANPPDVLYLCDQQSCKEGCSNPEWCKHTLDINHAVNFKKYEGDRGPCFVEREIEEDKHG